MPTYPRTVTEILDDTATYRPAALRAVKRFRRSKPWRGTHDERCGKFTQLNTDLAAVYGITPPELIFENRIDRDRFRRLRSGGDHYTPTTHTITLIGSPSVVTFLHEFAHARGWRSERQACRWSINLFRRIFPNSYARCRHHRHMLRAGRSAG